MSGFTVVFCESAICFYVTHQQDIYGIHILAFLTLIFPPLLFFLKLLSFLSTVFSDGYFLVFIKRKKIMQSAPPSFFRGKTFSLGFMHMLLGYFTCESLSNLYTRFCAINKKTGNLLKRQDKNQLT